jgi:hypothetical protein
VPDDHAGTDFILLGHGAQASADAERCAVCHTRELCSSCHVNAAGVDAIGSVPAAAGIVAAELPPVDVQYPKPASHASPDFLEEHGARASGASCSTCHTQDSCLTCHVGTVPAVVMELPAGSEVVAPGVPAVRRMPTSHSAPGFTFDFRRDIPKVERPFAWDGRLQRAWIFQHETNGTAKPFRFVFINAVHNIDKPDDCAADHLFLFLIR